MMTFLTAALLSTSLTLASPPSKEDGEAHNDEQGKRVRIVAPKEEVIDMVGAKVAGEVDSPGLKYIISRNTQDFDAIIAERENFKRELLEGLDKI